MVVVWYGLLSIVYIWLTLPFEVYFALAGMFLLGVSCGFLNVTVTSTLQLRARDVVGGHVMAMYTIGIRQCLNSARPEFYGVAGTKAGGSMLTGFGGGTCRAMSKSRSIR